MTVEDLWRDPIGYGLLPSAEPKVSVLSDCNPSRGWQPIETLPHDGDEDDRAACGHWHGPVLVYVPDQYGGVCLVAQLDADMWIVGDAHRAFADLDLKPTHWMPLPAPPAQAIEAGTAETGTGSVHESAVGSADAPHPGAPQLHLQSQSLKTESAS